MHNKHKDKSIRKAYVIARFFCLSKISNRCNIKQRLDNMCLSCCKFARFTQKNLHKIKSFSLQLTHFCCYCCK